MTVDFAFRTTIFRWHECEHATVTPPGGYLSCTSFVFPQTAIESLNITAHADSSNVFCDDVRSWHGVAKLSIRGQMHQSRRRRPFSPLMTNLLTNDWSSVRYLSAKSHLQRGLLIVRSYHRLSDR